jgi:predicted nucleic acid-binding protein
MDGILEQDTEMLVWWETEVECVGALSTKFKSNNFDNSQVEQALERLADIIESWAEVQPSDQVRIRAERLLFNHRLSSADAMQLASALFWCEDDARTAEFVCQDRRLRTAARREGFTVLPSSVRAGSAF